MSQMAMVSGSEFNGSSWEDLIQWFEQCDEHYTAENYFEGGGRAPLLFEAFRYLEASLDICRAAAKQVHGPQSAG